MNFPTFCKQKEAFSSAIDGVYQYAIENKSYYGADVWNFFNEEYISNMKTSTNEYEFKNKVIVLTDGYLNFERAIESRRPDGTYMRGYYRMRNKKNWKEVFENRRYKLTPHDHEYHNLEVMILEVDPKKPTEYTNEFDILSHYWKTWFNDMGISCEVYPKSKPAKDLIPMLRNSLFQ